MTKLTARQLEAICKRVEAATGEEWTDFDEHSGGNVVYEYDRLTEGNDSIIAECETAADAEFIANAREDIPALLAEVERLQGELNGDGLLTLQDQVDHARDYIAELITKYQDMTSIALWSTRRLPKIHKDFAYGEIEANLGEEVERV